MERKMLPLGVDGFEKLREDNYYYVDKTPLIKDLLNDLNEVNLFTRPRRFGKTLAMSMLKAFFEIGSDGARFDGLSIANEKALCEAHRGKYPVVFVSLKAVDGLTFREARSRLAMLIRGEAMRFQYLLDSERLTSYEKDALRRLLGGDADDEILWNSLKLLTELLEKHHGQRTILLIDEYDVPLDRAYLNGYYEEMISLIRALFGQALKTNDSLRFAVLTGCLRVSKESIFTGLNNLKVHSISDARFGEYFGFTDAEVGALLSYYGLEARRDEVREWYDGYRFGETNVYCPWDVINYCYDVLADERAEPQAYWLNTSGNDIVRRLIDRARTGTTRLEIERLIAGESIVKALNERLTHSEIDRDIGAMWSLLYMTGYLTTRERPRQGRYELALPNREVRSIFKEQVLSWLDDSARADAERLGGLYEAFETGDAERIEEILNGRLVAAISYHDARESFYHGFLLALLSACADWEATSNAETGKGRSDILVERADGKRGFVVEVKAVKETGKLGAACESALRQIEEMDYAAVLRRYRVKDVWIYGIAFCDKECAVRARRVE